VVPAAARGGAERAPEIGEKEAPGFMLAVVGKFQRWRGKRLTFTSFGR